MEVALKTKILLLILIAALLTACALPDSLSSLLSRFTPQVELDAESNSLLNLVESGKVRVVSIRGASGLNVLTGRSIELEVFNTTEQDLEVEIPCGLVFIPDTEGSSRMMVVQRSVISLTKGNMKSIRLYVLSIDALLKLPSADKTYRVEALEAGKSLDFANCLCQADLPAETDTNELINLQLAAWMVSSDQLISEIPENLNDMVAEITGLPINFPGMDKAIQDMAQTVIPGANAWLDRCEIKVGK